MPSHHSHPFNWRRALTLAWLSTMVAPWAWGTHLVGGDFHYVHLGGDEYSIVLTVYRDCSPANTNGTGFDAFAAVGMWDGTGTIGPEDVITMTLSQTNVSTVPVEMGNPCGTPPPELCIEKAVYTTTVELPSNPYGWDLVYQRCCRNPTIVNLDNFGGGENAGMSLEVHIPGTDVLDGDNSSPAFQELPPVALCSNLPFVWDHSAVDPDGDDLVYSLCPPQQGGDPNNAQPNPPTTPPYVDVPYVAGFSWDNPMTADPSLSIDPSTGELTCTPTMPGQYAIGICVEEYRDGVLLSMVRRDFQFNVTTCEPTEIVLEADAVPFAAGGLMNLVPYEDALGLPAVLEYPNGETFPMAAWLANNDMAVTVDGETMVVDAVVMEGCNDARFTIERSESESDMTDTTYLTLTGSAVQGLDFDENFYEVVMAAGETSSDITLGLEDDGFEEGVEHLRIECNYVNACDQLSSTVARVVLVDPIPIVPTPAPLSCLEEDGSQTLGYDDISGYGPFMYEWDGDPWGNATQAPGAWTVQFDSTFSFVDGSGQLAFETMVDLSITDQCGKSLLHTIPVLHPVATETALCPLEAIEFPAENDGIPVADVLYNGVSILNNPESGVPLLANATPAGRPLGVGRVGSARHLGVVVRTTELGGHVRFCDRGHGARAQLRHPQRVHPRRPGWQQLVPHPWPVQLGRHPARGVEPLRGGSLVGPNHVQRPIGTGVERATPQRRPRGGWTLPMGAHAPRWPAAARQPACVSFALSQPFAAIQRYLCAARTFDVAS